MSEQTVPMTIEVVSDVVCPWCAVGVSSLMRAVEQLEGELSPRIRFEPFELNPTLGPGGADIVDYLSRKYGSTPAQIEQMHAKIAERGASVGFAFSMDKRSRTYNTFDAHRLLHWAGEVDAEDGGTRQLALKQALLSAHFTDGRDPGDHGLLIRLCDAVGLDPNQAAVILTGNAHADAVREREQYWQELGIHSVPAFIVNDTHLIEGGQPPEVFVAALRQIAAERAGDAGPETTASTDLEL
ncbi:DsbA family oxidoreductase [Leptothrix discophora]|uniref:DsbA family oxidoreductase n=1 Tax=Leptothrix discophora TaxID=89 RepID=A0ABT9G3X7_LEPDI|nr:DsbA family oxidoreductase [Leptothrix discophora]MDP4301201.1 DsbA family oxidoreductase [Leptothrix discophora]